MEPGAEKKMETFNVLALICFPFRENMQSPPCITDTITDSEDGSSSAEVISAVYRAALCCNHRRASQ